MEKEILAGRLTKFTPIGTAYCNTDSVFKEHCIFVCVGSIIAVLYM